MVVGENPLNRNGKYLLFYLINSDIVWSYMKI